jgi:hypothetical protein
MPRKQPISLEQRRALRSWAHQQHPKPSQKQCIEWFLQQYNHRLSQSTVSESLSHHFDCLDDAPNANRARLRTGQWPEVERLLLTWQLRIESKGGFTTGDLLQQKAREIWERIPHDTTTCPDFSTGWLRRFKARHNIKVRIQHGEAGSTPASAEDEMKALQTIAGEYEDNNIYNMDETGLFWKMMPSRGLSTQSQPGSELSIVSAYWRIAVRIAVRIRTTIFLSVLAYCVYALQNSIRPYDTAVLERI